MSGTVIRVIEDTKYDFVNLASSGSQNIVVAQRIDVSQFRTASLLVRFVKLDIAQPNDAIGIGAVVDPWDPFEGSTLYATPDATTGEAAVPLSPSTLNPNGDSSAPPTEPYSMFFPLNTPFGGLLRVALVGSRSGASTGDALNIQLNADLILKD